MQLKKIKTGALVLFGEDDTFTATGAQQLVDGIDRSKKMVSARQSESGQVSKARYFSNGSHGAGLVSVKDAFSVFFSPLQESDFRVISSDVAIGRAVRK